MSDLRLVLKNNRYVATAHYDVDRGYAVNGLNQYTATDNKDAQGNVIAGSGASFTDEPRGNLTNNGSVTFTYDMENRLVAAFGAKQATLTYDPLGRLWEVDGTAGGGLTTRFLYDGDGSSLAIIPRMIASRHGCRSRRRTSTARTI